MNIINKIIINTIPLLPKFAVKLIANNYVAGELPQEALQKVKYLNSKGYHVTIDLLGEHINDNTEVKKITSIYSNLLDSIYNESLKCNISVKPTHIGLDISAEEFNNNCLDLVRKASKLNNFVRLDMENSKTTSQTISTFEKINRDFRCIGTVFQAYLKRTYDDILKYHKPINFRLCKGIYNESSNISFKNKDEINENYLKIVELAFKKTHYIGLATHDTYLIEKIYELIEKYNVNKNNFEFQVLYGVPMHGWLEKHLKNNFKVRIYLPYGPQWYEYSIRRLKENPSIAKHVAKSLFSNRDY